MTASETALVTGAGSGIGRAVARRLAGRGASVALLDVSVKGLEETVSLIQEQGGTTTPLQTDVTVEAQVRVAVDAAVKRFGRLNTAVACAGVEVMGTIPEMDHADWDRVLAVNLTGVFHTARHAIPAMDSDSGAAFVAISSDAGVQGAAEFGAYCATKHGVIGLVRSLALDHGPQGIRCNAVCPGFVRTPMADRIFDDLSSEDIDAWAKTVPLGRFAEPGEVADAVAHITSDEASYMNGAVYSLDGGATAGYFQG